MNSEKTTTPVDDVSAIGKLAAAFDEALEAAPLAEVLAFLTGAFVGIVVEVVHREGLNVTEEIKIDGGKYRDITIHAPK